VSPRQWYTGEVVTDPASVTVWQSSASRTTTGTVSATTDSKVGNWSYTYDPLNRLQTAAGPTGHLSYTIDAFGNKSLQTVTSGTGPSPQGYQVAANNALTGNGLTYDQAGNVTNDGFHRYAYDVEGRLYQVDGTTCYIYDGDGDRVARTNCNVSGVGFGTITGVLAEFLYDTNHRLLAEVNAASQQMANGNIWAGGQLVAQDAPDANVTTATSTQLRITDQVGSLRGLLDLGEHVVQSCTSFPFGDGATCSSPAAQFFTGKERDAETSLDYFGARYYNSTLGRFTSPDPGSPTPLHLLNPQRWNMYSYGLNNPFLYTDSTGRDAAAVNFSKEIAIVGHEGILSVHSDGTTTYARFGPVGGGRPTGEGQVQSFTLNSTVKFDSGGQPTTDSLNAIKQELSSSNLSPEQGQDPSSIRLNYFKTTDAETANLDQWIKQQQDASNRGQAPNYNFLTNNCTMFCQRGLVAGNAITQSQADRYSIVPNIFFYQLNQEPKATVTTSECDTLPDGSQRCQ
jgi:RHS repeat-associated protein